MLPSTLLTSIAFLLLFTLAAFPSPFTAQPSHYPQRTWHGYSPTTFATSPSFETSHLLWIVDDEQHVAVVNTRDGSVVRNASFTEHYMQRLGAIALDSKSKSVFVVAYDDRQGAEQQLLVLDGDLNQVGGVPFSSLKPAPSDTREMQLIVDSTDTIYLFDSYQRSSALGTVWVLSPNQWTQQQTWKAPISLTNYTGCVLAIDNADYLYFQDASGYQMLWITDDAGAVQAQFQLGTGNMSEPRITDVAIDAQQQMWHTYERSSYISVSDSNGKLLVLYDVMTPYQWRPNHIRVDSQNNVIVSDILELSLLYVSQRGDIINTVTSPIMPMWGVNELLGDYVNDGRGGGGSVVFYTYYSSYPAQRISADDLDTGTLLQRYTLPPRLADSCVRVAIDIGSRTGNIYVLLECYYITRQNPYTLVYVLSRSGRVVSELRVGVADMFGNRVRVDEGAGIIYVAYLKYESRFNRTSSVVAYSAVDGSQLAMNFSTPSPLSYIADIVLIPAGPQGGSSTLLITDTDNRRFLFFPTNNTNNKPQILAYPQGITYTWLTSSLGPQSSFYARGNKVDLNGTYTGGAFVHKIDYSNFGNPKIMDIFLPPPGVNYASISSIVVGRDRHLYAVDYQTGSLYQWKETDDPPPPPPASSSEHADDLRQSENAEPRVHVAEAGVESDDAQHAEVSKLAATTRLSVQSRHSHMRGANWD